MAASAEYVPWAAFCRGVHAVTSRALRSAPESTSTSTVSMKPHPVKAQRSAVKANSSANQADAYQQQGVVQPQQQRCLMQQLSMLA